MSYCPNCDEYFEGNLSTCPKCNADLDNGFDASPNANNKGWIVIGHVRDKTTADYARETLESYGISAVIFSESGFFGEAGLNLPSPSGKNLGTFKIQVPSELVRDGINILNMILGDSWEKAIETDTDE